MARGSAQSRSQQWRAQQEAWQREDAHLTRTQADLALQIRGRQDELRALQQRAAVVDEQRSSGALRHSRMSQVRALGAGL